MNRPIEETPSSPSPAADIQTPILDFLEQEILPLYRPVLEQFEKFRVNGYLPHPVDRVYHTYVNNANLAGMVHVEGCRESLAERTARPEQPEPFVERTRERAKGYEKQALEVMLLRVKACEGTELSRIHAFEARVDFDAVGWEGPKPSEMIEQIAAKAEAFVAENKNIVKATLSYDDGIQRPARSNHAPHR